MYQVFGEAGAGLILSLSRLLAATGNEPGPLNGAIAHCLIKSSPKCNPELGSGWGRVVSTMPRSSCSHQLWLLTSDAHQLPRGRTPLSPIQLLTAEPSPLTPQATWGSHADDSARPSDVRHSLCSQKPLPAPGVGVLVFASVSGWASHKSDCFGKNAGWKARKPGL